MKYKHSIKILFSVSLICSMFLWSCSGNKIDRTDFLPKNSAMVLKLNSQSLFSDSFMDFLGNMDLLDELSSGGSMEILKHPESVGIERLAEHYVFISGEDMKSIRGGAVIALNSAEKLKAYFEEEGETIEVTGKVSTTSMSQGVIAAWDENTLVIYYGAFAGEDVVPEVVALLQETSSANIAVNKPSFNELKDSESHVSVWTSNEELVKLYGVAGNMAKLYGGMGVPQVPENSKNSFGFFTMDFQEAKIAFQFKQFLNDEQFTQLKTVTKENNIKDYLNICENENTLGWLSLSLSSEGIYQSITKYDALANQVDKNLMGLTNIKEISSMLTGDVFVSLNDVISQKKKVFEGEMNYETGEYEMKEVEKEELTPFVTVAIGLADQVKLEEKIAMITANLPQENGVYNYKDEYFFSIKNNTLFLASSSKAKTLLPDGLKELNEAHSKLASTQPSALFLDIDGLINVTSPGLRKERDKAFFQLISSYMNDLVIDGYQEVGQTTIQDFSLTFKKKENALIQILKMVSEVKKLSQSNAL